MCACGCCADTVSCVRHDVQHLWGAHQPAPRLLHLGSPLADDVAQQTRTDTAQATLACAYRTWQDCHDEDDYPVAQLTLTYPTLPISSKAALAGGRVPGCRGGARGAAGRTAGRPVAAARCRACTRLRPVHRRRRGEACARGRVRRWPWFTCGHLRNTCGSDLGCFVPKSGQRNGKHWRRLSCQGRVCMDVLLCVVKAFRLLNSQP